MGLILTRRKGEQVVCGDTTITVADIARDAVKLVFTGPKSTRILRKEIIEKESGKSSSKTD